MSILRFAPPLLKRWGHALLQRLRERRAIRRLHRSAPHPPEPSVLELLMRAWGNRAYRADVAYLAYVASACAEARGPVLECGTGVTTIVASIYATHGVWSLEQHAPSAGRIRSVLARNGLEATVVDAPLIDHGDYEWYATSPELPGEFAVVICDGPPGSTKGGRYGLIPVAEGLLRPDVVVLLDDADRPGEQEMLRRWQSESSYTWRAPHVNGRSFAIVRRSVSN